jgi:hypothetical protein
MYRTALAYLKTWKDKPSRKPLVLRGARQVGKSFLVRMLAAEAFDNLIEINLETDPEAPSLFASKDPRTIVPLLEARYGQTVRAGATLLFLDEIQVAPELFAGLRYFHERMPELHVVAAGSLLDFALAAPGFSVPVGRIEYLNLGPMSFSEFLLALDRASLHQFLCQYSVGREVPQAMHGELLRLLRQFLVVGGMPASVAAFLGPGTHRDSEAERQAILSTFREDFARYGKRVDHRRLDKVFAKIPRMAGSKFSYSQVDREERSRELSRSLDLLCLARVAYRVRHTSGNGVPLGAEADDRSFKVLFMDVGLLCRSCGLTVLDMERAEDLMMVNAGTVCEQFAGQHLLHAGDFFAEPELYCWMREKSQSSAEVDYLISVGGVVVPVEIKAGKTGTLKSLHVFLREKERDFGLRLNIDLPSLLEAETCLAGGDNRPFRLLSLPLYLVEQASRLCRECLQA